MELDLEQSKLDLHKSELDLQQKRKEKEKEVLVLEDEQLKVQSETWMKDQRDIQETLAAEASAGAEAEAVIQGINSRAASPNLGLESLTTNEKMNRFLGTPEPEECSQCI
jgi:predicted Holliday junction resolvase-like endonuclease